MKALTFITDETNNKRYARIDLQLVSKYDNELMEDLMDIIISEARKSEKSTPWERVKADLGIK